VGTNTINATAKLAGHTNVTATTGVAPNGPDANKTYAEARITLDPLTATNVVGDVHRVTATVMEDVGGGWVAASGETVAFSRLNNTAGAAIVNSSLTTNVSGQAWVEINTASAGSVDIHAVCDVVVGTLTLHRETDGAGKNSGDANKVYIAVIDMELEKSINPTEPNVGDTVTFTLAVSNKDSTAATNVAVEDVLPDGYTYIGGSISGGDGRSETGAPTLTWTINSLAAGTNTNLTFQATVEQGGEYRNVAQVTAHDETDIDSTPNNDDGDQSEDDEDFTTIPSADLEVSKTVNNDIPVEGETIVFTITLTNNGPNAATNVEITDALPPELEYVSDDGAGSYNLGANLWTVSFLTFGSSTTLSITATVRAGTGGDTITNTAEVTAADQPDPDSTPNNNDPNEDDQDSVDIMVSEEAGRGGELDEPCQERVIISEIAWAGTAADPWGEWIELRNLGTIPVDLTDWILRWRRKITTSPEEERWKEVRLFGILMPAITSACELADREPAATVQIEKNDRDDVSWLISGQLEQDDESHFLLERWHDETVTNEVADLIYDTTSPYNLELTDFGDIVQLINADGVIVDTANFFELEQDGWPAGSAITLGTMERTDPLGPDTRDNWHTNEGILVHGLDALERPLVASASVINSTQLEELDEFIDIPPTKHRAGESLEVGIELADSGVVGGGGATDAGSWRAAGWPWIRVTSPDLAEGAVGGGGAADLGAVTSFSGHYEGDTYWLTIDTGGLAPGRYNFWVVYGQGETAYVPIVIVP